MKLAAIVQGKDGEIHKIRANARVAEAATVLTEHHIGALLVEDENAEIVGIFSERDIVRAMGPHGADLHDVAVSELMTRDIIQCSANDTVNEVLAMMNDRHIRHLPVFDGDDLVGFISIRDLVRCRINEIQAEAEAMRQYIAS